MKRFLFLALILVTTTLFPSQIQMKACPGEGPQPLFLQDISSSFSAPDQIKTMGAVKDFVVSEESSSLYYRNESARVYQMDMETESSTLLTRSNIPLSKVIDAEGRYLMTQAANFIFDNFYPQFGWKYIGTPAEGSITPLYWKRFLFPKKKDVFYEIANWRDRATGKQRITVYSYSEGKWTPNHCKIGNIQGTIKLGEGHFAPNVFLYESIPNGENTKLRLYNINIAGPVFTCELKLAYEYVHTIPGTVRSVSQFEGSKMFAVRTTDKERNLIWTNKEDGKGCRYFNFAERESFVINSSQPVIAAWGRYDGLTLVYPNEEKRASILPGSQYIPMNKNNIWMNSSGDELISALPSDYNNFSLYKTKLK